MSPGDVSTEQLAGRIEHTLLKPEATAEQIDRLCDEAIHHGFRAVCVNPIWVRRCHNRIAATLAGLTSRRPTVVSVAGFPLGASLSETKADEARRALDDGATEIDMVANIGALVAGDGNSVRDDIAILARSVHSLRGLLKVILETRVLDKSRIILGCRWCAEGEADFVKTSTGLHPSGGATAEHVRLLFRHASPMGVKAAGGIRTLETALAMIEAGAARIGTSAGPSIMEQFNERPR
jgi:deoxyribose-phosphate aldolase